MCVNTIIATILAIVLISFAFVIKFKINNNKDENIKEEIIQSILVENSKIYFIGIIFGYDFNGVLYSSESV